MDANLANIVVTFIVLLLSLSVHESAHAWTADNLGDPTARYLGRVSLNPIVHMDVFGTLIFPLIGLFAGGFLFGWAKPVPVNVNLLKNPTRDHALVAAAGPGSNLLIAIGLFLFLMILKMSSPETADLVRRVSSGFDRGDSMLVPLVMLAVAGIKLNIVLAVFNFIPVAPLDGAAILSGLLPAPVANALDHLQPYGLYILIGLVYFGIPSYFYIPITNMVHSWLQV